MDGKQALGLVFHWAREGWPISDYPSQVVFEAATAYVVALEAMVESMAPKSEPL